MAEEGKNGMRTLPANSFFHRHRAASASTGGDNRVILSLYFRAVAALMVVRDNSNSNLEVIILTAF